MICAVAALAAALLAFAGLRGSAHETQLDPQTLTDQEVELPEPVVSEADRRS